MNQVFDRGFKSWCEKVSEGFRKDLGLKVTDPLDAWLLAKELGIVVWTPEAIPGLDSATLKQLTRTDPSSWSAATICWDSQELIILNSQHSKARQSSDLMHEMSHLIIGHPPARADIDETGFLMLSSYDKKQEEEANWLAGTLLLPRAALLHILISRMDEETAASRYNASRDMLQWRKNVTGAALQAKRGGHYVLGKTRGR